MKIFIILLMSVCCLTIQAQNDENFKYMRSSLCIMMVEHPELEFNAEIENVFRNMKIPNRFNSHDLGVRVIRFANDDNQQRNIELFANNQQVAKRMVAKWFGRNKQTGTFDTELLRERGHYAATKIDVNSARMQARGVALLEDMGEHLIGHTYWVVNDVKYVNHSNFASNVKNGMVALGGVTDMVSDVASSKKGSELSLASSSDKALSFMDNIKGFRVKITSYLFRLKWNEEVANTFYTQYYTEDASGDFNKKAAFRGLSGLFTLEYVGQTTSTSSKTSMSKKNTKEDMIEKVCTRALDKNLADLQHEYAEFRIKAPLVSTEPLKVYIGMKEDVTPKRRYEVLEVQEDQEGRHSYKRVGVIKPMENKIWDNRFMADEEGTVESQLDGTLFEKVSGGEFLPGMLVREMK